MSKTPLLCLQCKLVEGQCKCLGGFKIIYWCGKPVSKKEADDIAHELKPETQKQRVADVEKALKNLL